MGMPNGDEYFEKMGSTRFSPVFGVRIVPFSFQDVFHNTKFFTVYWPYKDQHPFLINTHVYGAYVTAVVTSIIAYSLSGDPR